MSFRVFSPFPDRVFFCCFVVAARAVAVVSQHPAEHAELGGWGPVCTAKLLALALTLAPQLLEAVLAHPYATAAALGVAVLALNRLRPKPVVTWESSVRAHSPLVELLPGLWYVEGSLPHMVRPRAPAHPSPRLLSHLVR